MIPPLPHQPVHLFTLACAVGAASAFLLNIFWFRAPVAPGAHAPSATEPVSILIPARNEEQGIAAAIESALATVGPFELVVLDDASIDRTAAIVESIAQRDPRVRLVSASALPTGWNGKQHACHLLSGLARYDWLCFLDADVRIGPELVPALLAYAQSTRSDLVSGFPLQQTGTWLERMLIPLIHFVLLCYLPIPVMRLQPTLPSVAAGCGQVMLARRKAYAACGGHAAIRTSMHDGLLLPRRFRAHGFRTDLLDLTELAHCRMYRGAREVWQGLGKNATEGMATPLRIVPFTLLLFFGQVMPVVWLVVALAAHHSVVWPLFALLCGYGTRAIAMWRFHQSLLGALLHPVAIVIALALQWWALGRKLFRVQSVWKQRAYDLG